MSLRLCPRPLWGLAQGPRAEFLQKVVDTVYGRLGFRAVPSGSRWADANHPHPNKGKSIGNKIEAGLRGLCRGL